MAGFDNGYLTANGAYGREATEADWKAGKDFQIVSGPYFSIRDSEAIKVQWGNKIVFYNKRGYVAFIVDL